MSNGESLKKVSVTVIVLAVTACVPVLPVIGQLGSALPLRHNNLTTVPLFNAWTIWWNADQVAQGFDGYWSAPIFFPERSAFAFSEPQPATVIVAPVVWITGSPAAAYNVYLLLSLFLNGFVTWLLLRRQRVSWLAAVAGGVMMIWLPVSLRQIEVLQLIPIWPLLWTWDALRRHGARPGWWRSLELAAAYTISFYTCIHHTLFLTVLLVVTGWFLLSKVFTCRFWTTTVLALMVAAVLVAIVFVPMRQALDGQSFSRSEDLIRQLSARASDLILVPNDAYLRLTHRQGFGMSPGWIKVALGLAGVLLGLIRRRHRRWSLFLLVTVVSSGVLAMGPHLRIGEWEPWWTLAEWFPGMNKVRNVFRFSYMMQMAVILLAVVALSETHLRLKCRMKRRWLANVVVGTLSIAAIAEVPPPTPMLAGTPDLSRHHGWTDYVRQKTPHGKAIACIPFAPGTRAADFDVTTRWMYYGTLHGVPMVNGYSGFFPPKYMELRSLVTENGLTDAALQELAALNVHFVVVQRNYALPRTDSGESDAVTLRLELEDPAGIDVYRLQRN